MDAEIVLRVDGTEHPAAVDTRTTLLDALRERITDSWSAAHARQTARRGCRAR